MHSSGLAVQAQGLRKEYRTPGEEVAVAVEQLDLRIQRAEIYALLGPNGAGKTTTISMLSTLLTPTAGIAKVAGYDVVQEAALVRRQIGLTFQEVTLDQELSGRRILDFHARLYGLDKTTRAQRIAELARLVELVDVLDRRVTTYSGGMKRRLELARGLVTYPRVLFLDEPTQGLDPQNRAEIWRYIRGLRDAHGMTILLTTHNMEEAEELSDRVGIIDRGQLIIEGSPDELIQNMGADMVTIVGRGRMDMLAEEVSSQPFVSVCRPAFSDGKGTLLQIGVDNGDRRLPQLISLALQSGVTVSEARVTRPTLADVFLAHTGRELRDR